MLLEEMTDCEQCGYDKDFLIHVKIHQKVYSHRDDNFIYYDDVEQWICKECFDKQE